MKLLLFRVEGGLELRGLEGPPQGAEDSGYMRKESRYRKMELRAWRFGS